MEKQQQQKNFTRGVARLFEMRGRQGRLKGDLLGLKMVALHRPLYKVSFHLGA